MRGVYEKVKGSNDWWISYFDADGRHHRERVGRFSVARTAYEKRKAEIREGTFISPDKTKGGPTFEELFELRMTAVGRDLSPQTIKHHRYQFASEHLARLRKLPARKITPRDVEELLGSLHEKGLSPGTIATYRNILGLVFNYGVKHDYVWTNPVLKTQAPQGVKERVRFLSDEEEQRLRAAIRKFWPDQTREAQLDLHLHTGMRVGEAWRLTWDRVQLDRGVIDVPKNGKTGWRQVPINSVCRRALHELQKEAEVFGSSFVIPRAPNASADHNLALTLWFAKACEEANVANATPHTLRHTFASRLVMAGVNLRRVQEFLGHATIVMTMKYAHLSPERGHADIERLVTPAAAMPPAMPTAVRARVVKIA